EKRRLADLEKRALIKSATKIIDSSDDEDDAAFFERERELRERMARRALEGELPSSGTRKIGTKKKLREKKPRALEQSSEMDASANDEIEILGIEKSGSPISLVDDESEDG